MHHKDNPQIPLVLLEQAAKLPKGDREEALLKLLKHHHPILQQQQGGRGSKANNTKTK